MKPGISFSTPNDTAILLVDHQPGVMGMIGSLPKATVANNALMTGSARLAPS